MVVGKKKRVISNQEQVIRCQSESGVISTKSGNVFRMHKKLTVFKTSKILKTVNVIQSLIRWSYSSN